MRILSLTLWIVLVTAPAAAAQQLHTAEPTQDAQIEQLESLLETSKRAYSAGEIEIGYAEAEAALLLAKVLEPALLQPPDSASEQLARADLLLELGKTARIQDDDTRARRYLNASLELYERSSGHQQPKLADVLIILSGLAYEEGQLEPWRTMMNRALKIQIDAFGKYHPKVAQTLGILGTEREQVGDLAAAEDYFRRAVTALEESQPPTDLELGFAYLNLARVLKARGEPQEAARLERQGREILHQNPP